MGTFIKIINTDKAQELISLGYQYVIETMNQRPIHCFLYSEELMNYVDQNFEKHDFLLSNKLSF